MIMTPELILYAKQFTDNYLSQDNAATAFPYAYVVQQEKEHLRPVGYGNDGPRLYDGSLIDHRPMTEDQIKELNKAMAEDGGAIDIDDLDCIGEVVTEYVDVQWFFTEAEADNYLSKDAHNLTKPRKYVKYLNRNQEAVNILKIMFAVAGKTQALSERMAE